jgi:hypothetical protein
MGVAVSAAVMVVVWAVVVALVGMVGMAVGVCPWIVVIHVKDVDVGVAVDERSVAMLVVVRVLVGAG